MMIVAALAVFLGLLGVGIMAISPTFTSAGSRRLQTMDEFVGHVRTKGSSKSVARPGAISEQILGLSDKLTRERESTAKTVILLERADLPFRSNEWYVLRMVAVGRANREIADLLVLSEKTVRNHMEHIYTKAGVSNRVSASLFALKHGITRAT